MAARRMRSDINLHLLHGFLQTQRVWNCFQGKLSGVNHSVDLWADLKDDPQSWATRFCAKIESTVQSDEKQVLIGYSLGGRLAMLTLTICPSLWSGAIFISAHPGALDLNQRDGWLAHDQSWAARFRSESWDSLVSDWDAQAVFGGRANPNPPREADFSRGQLATCLVTCSKGRQECLTEQLRFAGCPMLYLSGEQDTNYTALGAQLAQAIPNLKHEIIPNAGHRVPWEQPEAFSEAVNDFTRSL